MVDMATNRILDLYSMLRRELALTRAAELGEKDFGHMQMVILYRLTLSPATMGEIAECTLADKASATRAVASLEKAGLMTRKTAATDRRVTMVELTRKGRKQAADAVKVRGKIEQKIIRSLDSTERREFARLLGKVADGLRSQRLKKRTTA
jgi:DNA-binding MarR family transcriptional regulator